MLGILSLKLRACLPRKSMGGFDSLPFLGGQKKPIFRGKLAVRFSRFVNTTVKDEGFPPSSTYILLMDEILHHLGCIICIKTLSIMGWTNYQLVSRISSINSRSHLTSTSPSQKIPRLLGNVIDLGGACWHIPASVSSHQSWSRSVNIVGNVFICIYICINICVCV